VATKPDDTSARHLTPHEIQCFRADRGKFERDCGLFQNQCSQFQFRERQLFLNMNFILRWKISFSKRHFQIDRGQLFECLNSRLIALSEGNCSFSPGNISRIEGTNFCASVMSLSARDAILHSMIPPHHIFLFLDTISDLYGHSLF
jgi:hypothetical protein